MSLFVLSVVTLVAVGLTTIDARAYDNGPTGIFYHRITAFPFGNELTTRRWQKIDEARDLCTSVGKELPYVHSGQELNQLIAELNDMHKHGNLMYCNIIKPEHRRFWLANKMKTKGQVGFGDFGYSNMDDNGEYCASLYWREEDDIGYRLNGQPCHRRCNTICLRNKFFRELHMEHFHYIGPNHGRMTTYTGRHNYTGTQNKCAYYGKDLVTVSSTQDVLDLQEEIHRMGIYVLDEHRGLFEHRNFYLKSDGVGGDEYSPLRPEDAVPGDNCLLIGQEHSSHLLGYMNTWSGPCNVRHITLCTDDEPGRFYEKLTIYFDQVLNKADQEAFCLTEGKILPDIQTDEDVIDFGREIIRIRAEDRELASEEFWTPMMTDYDDWNRVTVETIVPGPYCVAISNWPWEIKEIWGLQARDCTQEKRVVCMSTN